MVLTSLMKSEACMLAIEDAERFIAPSSGDASRAWATRRIRWRAAALLVDDGDDPLLAPSSHECPRNFFEANQDKMFVNQ